MRNSQHNLTAGHQYLCERLMTQGPMRFDEFMAFALYDPQFGYYSKGQAIFGSGGDFITAPELTPLFGQTIGHSLVPIIEATGRIVYEFGAGTGKLARDILAVAHESIDKYIIVDLSGGLKQIQRQTIETSLGKAIADKVFWVSTLPESLTGILIGNELLDSIPVRRFRRNDEGIKEAYIQSEDGALSITWLDATAPSADAVTALEAAYGPWPRPYHVEISEQVDGWVRSITQRLKGLALMIDYGRAAQQYYAPTQSQGHLRAHAKHIAHDGFLEQIGQQDLTCHVNFSAVYEALRSAGGQLEGYSEQGQWLIQLGLLGHAVSYINENDINQAMRTKQAIQMLVNQSEMGEAFKVICWSANFEPSACALTEAFLQADESYRL